MKAQEIKINHMEYKVEFSFSDNSVSLFEFIMNHLEEKSRKERKKEDATFHNLI